MGRKTIFRTEVSHNGLNKYRVVTAYSQDELNRKVNTLKAQWDNQWKKQTEREIKKRDEEASIAYAAELSQQAEKQQNSLEELLIQHLNPRELNWKLERDYSIFSKPVPTPKEQISFPTEPLRTDDKYNKRPPFLIRISKTKTEEYTNENNRQFEQDHSDWLTTINTIKL